MSQSSKKYIWVARVPPGEMMKQTFLEPEVVEWLRNRGFVYLALVAPPRFGNLDFTTCQTLKLHSK